MLANRCKTLFLSSNTLSKYSRGFPREYFYQNGRELAALTAADKNISYAYGEGGLRISKTVNGTETQYCWDGSRLLAQKTGDAWMHFLYDETGSVIGFRYNGGIYVHLSMM